MGAPGMSLLLRLARPPPLWLGTGLTTCSLAWALRSPAGTLCPRARGLSSQRGREQAPRMRAAKPCFPSPKTQQWHCNGHISSKSPKLTHSPDFLFLNASTSCW